MKYIYPDYLPQFHCLAGACPDTCCKDWQIILDKKTLARYRAIPGPLGQAVHNALITEDGQTRFRLQDGHCPLLRSDGLCLIQVSLGERALCNTCRCHPRFIEEYGAVHEISLSLSCPAVAGLLLSRRTPIALVTRTDERPVTTYHSLDPARYLALVSIREQLFTLLRMQALPLSDRFACMLLLCRRAQRLLDEKRYDALPRLLDRFCTQERCANMRLRQRQSESSAFAPGLRLLKRMEHLTPEFDELLTAYPTQKARPSALGEMQAENLTFYFLFRYILKAVNDGFLLARMQSCAFHVLWIYELCRCAQNEQQCRQIAARYSKEVEHSEQNCALLLRKFRRGALRLPPLDALPSHQP